MVKVLSVKNLRRSGLSSVAISNLCSVCGEEKTIDHLFVQCKYSTSFSLNVVSRGVFLSRHKILHGSPLICQEGLCQILRFFENLEVP